MLRTKRMLVRSTAKLAKALGIRSLAPADTAAPDSPLDEWYGNVADSQLGPCYLIMHARSRLTVALRAGRPIEFARDFPKRLRSLLASIAIPDDVAHAALETLGAPVFAKTADRGLLGSLNEVCFTASQVELPRKVDEAHGLWLIEQELSCLPHLKLPEVQPRSAIMHLLCKGAPGRESGKDYEIVALDASDDVSLVRDLATGEHLRLVERHSDTIPGEVVAIRAAREWISNRTKCIAGEVISRRCDVARLSLTPLPLSHRGTWTSEALVTSNAVEPSYAETIRTQGTRDAYELEELSIRTELAEVEKELLTMLDGEHRIDSLIRAIALSALARDLRCIEAYACLGRLYRGYDYETALRYFDLGVAIGELSIPPDFDGILPWGLIENRAFLRCLNGQATCLWRLGHDEQAAQVFSKLLRLNPSDDQGVRFDLEALQRGDDALSALEKRSRLEQMNGLS